MKLNAKNVLFFITFIMNFSTLAIINNINKENEIMKSELNSTRNELNSVLVENQNERNAKIQEHIQNQLRKEFEKTCQQLQENITYYAIPQSNEKVVFYEVPNSIDTDFYAYMDYRCITDETTKQWEMQQNAWTDEQGLRRYNDEYMIALGSYYTDYKVGERFEITLENNITFNAIIGDLKQDIHTDENNMYSPVYQNWQLVKANVIEFIVDENELSNHVLALGSIHGYDNFNGNIVSIKKIIEETTERNNVSQDE